MVLSLLRLGPFLTEATLLKLFIVSFRDINTKATFPDLIIPFKFPTCISGWGGHIPSDNNPRTPPPPTTGFIDLCIIERGVDVGQGLLLFHEINMNT